MKITARLFAILLTITIVMGMVSGLASALYVSDSGFVKIGSLPDDGDYVATQGMCTDGKYIYTFKMPSGNNNLARFYQTNISTGKTVLMKVTYDTSLTNFLALGHGNDMCAVVHNGVTYLYLATMYNRSHSTFSTHSIWRFKVTGNTIQKDAYFDIIEYGTDDMDFTGLTVYKQTDTHVTLMTADGKYIYTMDIGHDQPSGTVDCKYVFSINYTNAPTPTGAPTYNYQSSGGTKYYGVQGMTYDNGRLYYVMTGSQSSSTAKDNYIFTYDIENYTDRSNVTAIPAESIFVTSSYYKYFLEFESVDIHDGVMYFSANASISGYYQEYDFCGKLKHQFAVTPEYTVNFCDEAGQSLQTVKVKQGETAKFTGTTPTKAYDDTNHYAFKEWLTAVGGSAATLTNIQKDMKVYAGFTATAHSYSETINTNPSCSAEGLKTFTCSCGRSYTEAIGKTEHTPKVINAKTPTCTVEGYSGDTVCSVCNASIAKGTVIATLPHSAVTDKGYAATCTKPGLSDGSHCKDCGKVLAPQTVLPLVPHNTVVVPGTPATCMGSGLTDGLKCKDCGATVQSQSVIPRLGHDYSYVNIGEKHIGTCSRCAKVLTQNHSYVDNHCVCGDTLAPEATVDEAITLRHTLNLASDISVNYVVETKLLANYDSYTLACEIPVYENNVQIGTRTLEIQPKVNGNYYYFTLEGLNAVSMNHEIKATLKMTKDGKDFVSKEDIYSIATYAYSQLNKETSAESLKALCANLLRYGSLTQVYKNYCTNSLPDSKLTEAQKTYLVDLEGVTFDAVNRTLDDIANPTVTWAGKSLILDSKVTLKFIYDATAYTGDPTKLTLRVTYKNTDGKTVTTQLTNPALYQADKNRYSFDFDGLLAAELRSVVSVGVYAGNTQISPTLEYSASSYGTGKPADLQTVCKALMAYSDCAKVYFAG